MKNILIPTDFSFQSLKLIHAAVKRFEGHQLKIYLVHAMEPENSISDLLFFKKRLKVNFLCTDNFLEACEVMQHKYESIISKIQIEFYFGQSVAYQRNFLEAKQIDAIVLPVNYNYVACSPSSVDPSRLWKNRLVPVIYETIAEMAVNNRFHDKRTEHLQSV